MFYDTLEYVLEKMNINSFYDFKSMDIRKVSGLIDTFMSADEDRKERFKNIIKKIVSDFTKEYFTSFAKSYLEKIKPKEEKRLD